MLFFPANRYVVAIVYKQVALINKARMFYWTLPQGEMKAGKYAGKIIKKLIQLRKSCFRVCQPLHMT